MDASGRCLAYLQQLTLSKRRAMGRSSAPCLRRLALLNTTLVHASKALRLAFPRLPAGGNIGLLVTGAGGVHRALGFSTDTPLAVLDRKQKGRKGQPLSALKRSRPPCPPGPDGEPPAKRLQPARALVPVLGCGREGLGAVLPAALLPARPRPPMAPPPPPAKQKLPPGQGPPPAPPPYRPKCARIGGIGQTDRQQATGLCWPTLAGGLQEGLLSWPPCSNTQGAKGEHVEGLHTAPAAEEGKNSPCTSGKDRWLGGQAPTRDRQEGGMACGPFTGGGRGSAAGVGAM